MQSSAPIRLRAPRQAVYKPLSAFREGPDHAMRVISALGLCLVLSGCGFSIPIKPLGGDDIVTGSVRPAPSTGVVSTPLGHGLNEEDWRRARSAMAVAVDPLGNGERTNWDNPDTGHSGVFASAGLPYARAGEVCRSWTAEIRTRGGVRNQQGAACRAPGDDWRIASNQHVANNGR